MTTLEHVEVRQPARVVGIAGGSGVRSHLNTLGIHVGDTIEVVDRAPFRGPVLVQIHGTRVALGRGVARKVTVERNGRERPLTD
jgi:ferrous iron transport protein A